MVRAVVQIVEATLLFVAEVGEVVGSEAPVFPMVSSNIVGIIAVAEGALGHEGELLGLGVGGGGEVHEGSGGTGELVGHFSWRLVAVWVLNEVFVIIVAHGNILESLLLSSGTSRPNSMSFCGIFSQSLLLFLCHPEEDIKQAEGGDDEHEEEVHDLERDVSLPLKIIPLILNRLKILLFGFLLLEFENLTLSSWFLHKLRNLLHLLR